MKKIIGFTLLSSFLVTGAFASVARLEALGEDQYGSQYIDDNRNMFLNAAMVNDHFDFATFEWGNTTQRTNTEATPKAQGGVFQKSGNMVYGVYFGADSNTASDLRTGGISGLVSRGADADLLNLAGQVQNENTVDLFIGGESSWKWGARLSYAAAENEQGVTYAAGKTASRIEKRGYLVGLGAVQGMNEIYANIGAGNEFKAEDVTDLGGDFHFKGKLGYQLGYVRSLKSNSKVWIEYRSQDVEEEEVAALSETWKVQKLKIAWAKTSKLNDKFSAFYKLAYSSDKQENRAFAANQEDYEVTFVKATIGYEVMLKDWLTLRGSISNNLMGETTATAAGGTSKEKRTIADSTDVKMGATIAFGDFAIDGLIGNDANGNGVAEDENGTIRTDALMSRVSMTYKF